MHPASDKTTATALLILRLTLGLFLLLWSIEKLILPSAAAGIAAEQALAQAAHHAAQLQLYGRGLAQAMGLPVRERLVLFTALGQVVAV